METYNCTRFEEIKNIRDQFADRHAKRMKELNDELAKAREAADFVKENQNAQILDDMIKELDSMLI